MTYIVNPKERAKHNRRLIYEFFIKNPCSTNRDAAAALDVSEVTVGKHARAIREGWRPAPEVSE